MNHLANQEILFIFLDQPCPIAHDNDIGIFLFHQLRFFLPSVRIFLFHQPGFFSAIRNEPFFGTVSSSDTFPSASDTFLPASDTFSFDSCVESCLKRCITQTSMSFIWTKTVTTARQAYFIASKTPHEGLNRREHLEELVAVVQGQST